MKESAQAIDDMYESMGELYADALPSKSQLFLGGGPTWVSAPLAGFLGEPIKQMAKALRNFINSFTFADTGLTQLLNAISDKIDTLSKIVAEISDVIDALAALFELLEGLHIYCGVESTGGARQFFTNAAAAEGVPNVGSDGFVIGVTALSTAPSADSFLALFNVFGANVESAFNAVASGGETVGGLLEGVGEAFDAVEFEGE